MCQKKIMPLLDLSISPAFVDDPDIDEHDFFVLAEVLAASAETELADTIKDLLRQQGFELPNNLLADTANAA